MPKYNQTELLDQFWVDLETDPAKQPPADLEPALATTTVRLQTLHVPDPDPAFARRLQIQVEQAAASNVARNGSWVARLFTPTSIGRLAATTVVLIGHRRFPRPLCQRPEQPTLPHYSTDHPARQSQPRQ